MPSVFIDIIHITSLHLHFLNVVITTKSINMGCFHSNSREEWNLSRHGCSMLNVFIQVLKTVISNTAKEEPTSNILILLLSNGIHSLRSPINKNSSKMTSKLRFILGNQPPTRIVCSFPFNMQLPNFITSKFKPKHIIGHVQIQVVLLTIWFKQLRLSHQICLWVFHLCLRNGWLCDSSSSSFRQFLPTFFWHLNCFFSLSGFFRKCLLRCFDWLIRAC